MTSAARPLTRRAADQRTDHRGAALPVGGPRRRDDARDRPRPRVRNLRVLPRSQPDRRSSPGRSGRRRSSRAPGGFWPSSPGRILVAGIALIIADPARPALRRSCCPTTRRSASGPLIKPILETIAGIPTIVLGFFAINFISPQLLIPILGKANIGSFSALAGGIVVGLLVTPVDRLHLRGRDAGGAARHARGRLRHGRHEVRGRSQGGLPGRDLGDHGLDHPGHEPGDRRDDGRAARGRNEARSSRSTRRRASRR